MKKIITLALAAIMMTTALAGCGGKKETGKVTITIGDWPDETQAEALEDLNKKKAEFEAMYPDIEIIPDTYKYDTKTFTMKASAGQLPTMFVTWFTEIELMIRNEYVADISKQAKEYDFKANLNPELLSILEGKNGELYGLPMTAYANGLYINKPLFKAAGLVDEKGEIKYPKTYQEMAEYAQIIKEKTGKGGYIIPTTNNCGGWHFQNIAWAFGVDFMEQREDGSWEATFNTDEGRAALQYIYDMKWKYNGFPDNTVIDQAEMQKLFAIGQGAMMIANPPVQNLFQKYDMNPEDVMVVPMPEGPAGSYSQMGGGVYMFSGAATPEQIEAALKWLTFTGYTYEFSDQSAESTKLNNKQTLENGGIVIGQDAFPVWNNEERVKKQMEVSAPYINVDMKDYENYFDFSSVTIKPEEPVCCQEMYAVLDKAIQEIMTNKNCDVNELVAKAAEDFQVNHLDKYEG